MEDEEEDEEEEMAPLGIICSSPSVLMMRNVSQMSRPDEDNKDEDEDDSQSKELIVESSD